MDDILRRGAGRQWDPCVVEHYLLGRPTFSAFCASAEQTEPGVQYVVQGWNADSSGKLNLAATSDHRGPPGYMQEVALE